MLNTRVLGEKKDFIGEEKWHAKAKINLINFGNDFVCDYRSENIGKTLVQRC